MKKWNRALGLLFLGWWMDGLLLIGDGLEGWMSDDGGMVGRGKSDFFCFPAPMGLSFWYHSKILNRVLVAGNNNMSANVE